MSMENHIFCVRSSTEVYTKYSCYFIVAKAKGPVSCIRKSLFVICQVFGTNRQYLLVLLSSIPLSACS